MPTYRYTAEDSAGYPTDGHIGADSVEEARQRLEAEGLRVLEIIQSEAGPYEPPPQEPLTTEEAERLAEDVAYLSAAGLPLSPGLRAAGDETDSPRLAHAFYRLAEQIEQGRSLEEVLATTEGLLPRSISGLIRAAARSGQLGPALTELVEHYRGTNELRRNLAKSMTYPVLVACLAALVIGFIFAFVVPGLQDLYEDFGAELPAATLVLFALRRIGIWLLLALLAVVAVVGLVVRHRWSPARRQAWIASVPLVGPLWHWLGLLEWVGLVRVLIRNQVGLLEALRLSSDGVSNAHVGELALAMADGIAHGRSLSQTMASLRQVPSSMVPLIRMGEESRSLTESLGVAREMLEERVRTRSLWLQTALPPILFVAIGSCVLFIAGALLLPLITLIQHLS